MEGAWHVEESPALGQEDEGWREEMWSKQGHAGEELGARWCGTLQALMKTGFYSESVGAWVSGSEKRSVMTLFASNGITLAAVWRDSMGQEQGWGAHQEAITATQVERMGLGPGCGNRAGEKEVGGSQIYFECRSNRIC